MSQKETPKIQMVDLMGQYKKLQPQIDQAILDTVRSGIFIGGPQVAAFQQQLATFLNANQVVACGNGTDALQIALMALGLQPGDEVIVPAFTYVATAEVIALLGLTPIMVDVKLDTFNVDPQQVEAAITERTKAIVPVHLFGQSADMEPLLQIAKKHQLKVVEDNAQSVGAQYTFSDHTTATTGTMGDVGCISFYPSKNLGAFGDAGAMSVMDENLGTTLRSIANHGQSTQRYYHDLIGVNSRLDAIQAAILNIKLAELPSFIAARQAAAAYYDQAFSTNAQLITPVRSHKSTHVFHQYTLRVLDDKRDELKSYLQAHGISSMIYYPVPLYKQEAFAKYWKTGKELPVTEQLCREVISLPMHTELDDTSLKHITDTVNRFFQ